ncbi:MAG: HAD hydrolase-like protein [Acidobacteria bacterium]|nr:HAD hydrolase-like protein [Acidobacteriota bacterium]
MKLLLFDVDGTLVLTGGAGVRAMNRAFEAVFGIPDAFRGVPMAGRTDPAILSDALAKFGVEPSAGHLADFTTAYFARLKQEVDAPVPTPIDGTSRRSFKGALPGVPELIGRLAVIETVHLGLLTGNYRDGARIKLAYFDLWRHFRCGAYGGDANLRHELVPVAMARAAEAGCPKGGLSDVIIIGDTTLDVDAARKAGVNCVAVATGGSDQAALRAAGADIVFENLLDTDAVVRVLTR